jgi:hypothetical protein
MSDFLGYLASANLLLLLCYVVYRLGLRPLTFYGLNRVFLWAAMGLSVCLPGVKIPLQRPALEQLDHLVVSYGANWGGGVYAVSPAPGLSIGQVSRWIFWLGVLVMGIRFLVQLLSLIRLHSKTIDAIVFGQRIKQMEEPRSAFSFLRSIYVHPALYSEADLKGIIAHERIHIRGGHAADLLVAEIAKIFFWFNPAAWLMKKAVAENLEFITDRAMLLSGVDRRAYQYALVRTSQVGFASPLVNAFNLSPIKIRIMKMNRKKSSGIQLIRYAGALVVMIGAALWINVSRAANFTPQSGGGFVAGTDSLPAPEKILLRGSSGPAGQSVILIDDAPGRMDDITPEEIGRIDVQDKDTSVVPHKTVRVVRTYTKAFMMRHPDRFRKVQAPKVNPLPAPKKSLPIALRGPSGQPVILIDDRPGRMEDISPDEIGLIDVQTKDSSVLPHKTVHVVRAYTKAFMKRHPDRFTDAPAMR